MKVKIGYLLFLGICLLLILISYFTPYQADDLVFILNAALYDYKIGVSDCFDLRPIFDFCIEHYMESNGRLANLSTPLTLVFMPKWLFSIVTGFMCGMIFYFSNKLIFLRLQGYGFHILTSILILALPWSHLFIPDFSLNYLWSCAFSICALYVFINFKCKPSITHCLLMFIAGAMHEGFSITTGSIMLAYLLFNAEKTRQKQLLVMFCFFGLGSLMPLLSPGIWSRNADVPPFALSNLFSVWTFINSWCFWLYAVMLTILLLIKKAANRINHNNKLLLISFFIAGLFNLIIVKWNPIGRNFFFGSFYSILGISLIANIFIKTKYISRYLAYAITTITIIHLCYVLIWQVRLNIEFNTITSLFEVSEDGTVYTDYTKEDYISVIALQKPVNTLYYSPLHREFFERYYGPHKKLSIIPKKLKSIEIIPGDNIINKSHSVYYIDNNLISTDVDRWENGMEYVVYITLKNHGLCCPTVIANHFENDIGQNLVYLQPKFVWRHQYNEEILDIKLISKAE